MDKTLRAVVSGSRLFNTVLAFLAAKRIYQILRLVAKRLPSRSGYYYLVPPGRPACVFQPSAMLSSRSRSSLKLSTTRLAPTLSN